jgi:hypothetical protein
MNIFNNFTKNKNNKRIISSDTSFSRLLRSLTGRITKIEDSIIVNGIEGIQFNVQAGYIAGGIGQIIDVSTGYVVENFVTTYNGVYNSEIPILQLPDVFKIVVKGGIDISTGKTVSSTFTIIVTKKQLLEQGKYLTVNPLTTTYSELAQTIKTKSDNYNEDKTYDTAIDEAKTKLANATSLDKSKLGDDYIYNEDVDNSLYAVQIFSTSQNIANSVHDESVDEFAVIHGIVDTIAELDENNISDVLGTSAGISSIIGNTSGTENIRDTILISNITQFIATINTKIVYIGTNNAVSGGSFKDAFTKVKQLSVASNDIVSSDNYQNAILSTDFIDSADGLESIVNEVTAAAAEIEIKTISQPRSVLQAFPIALNTIAMTIHSYGVLREEYESSI